jgi:hypothetical protein
MGQSGGPADPVAYAIVAAIAAASEAGEWDTAAAFLEAGRRRAGPTVSKVTSLADARAKREKGEGK